MSKRKRSRAAPGDLIVGTVTVLGVKVDVKRRRGTANLQLECLLEQDGKQHRERRSAKTTDLQTALANARALAVALVRVNGNLIPQTEEYLVARGNQLTLGEVFDAYRELRLTTLGPSCSTHARGVMKRFTHVWGPDTRVVDIDQARVDQYVAVRKIGISAPDLSPKTALGVKDTVVRDDFNWLSIILRYVGGLKHDGRKVLSGNPLEGLRFPRAAAHVLRPVADVRRFELCMEYAHILDDPTGHRSGPVLPVPARSGVFRVILFLARNTGRRVGAVRKLRFAHILRTEEQVREALAAAPGHEESWAADWPFGAIAWVSENDKKRYIRIMPISQRTREVLDEYIAQHYDGEDSGFLFPSLIGDPKKPIASSTLAEWLDEVEVFVRARGIVLPKLRQGQYHPFRRMWRSERSGAFDRRLIALVGGWKVETGVAMDDSYQLFTPTAMYLCAAFDPARDLGVDSPVPGVLVPGVAKRLLSPKHLERVLKELRGGGEEPAESEY